MLAEEYDQRHWDVWPYLVKRTWQQDTISQLQYFKNRLRMELSLKLIVDDFRNKKCAKYVSLRITSSKGDSSFYK
jgi:hypothetical protein